MKLSWWVPITLIIHISKIGVRERERERERDRERERERD